ncbi:hypothetical protein TNCT_560361 [Trichonephila clavata]|uniref:Uncharacterized protein n=1 Tax=Trichonephila clavata TaxID=2740835 RepID=A0A8X6IDD1_TRICU|nr:hypothetical protein TNCT_560361 [Trichonephila clavata]
MDAVWIQNLANQKLLWPQTCHITIYLHNLSRQWLFGPHAWSYQPLPGHHQVYLQHCNSVAVWTTCLVISATAWAPSSVSPALQLSGCLDYKSGHISHCLDTIKCISSVAIQWLFGLQVWSYQPLPGHHQVHLQRCTLVAVWTTNLVISATRCTATQWLFGLQVWSYQPLPGHHKAYLQRCTSVAVPTTSLIISFTAWTPSNESPALHFCRCLDYKSGHISYCLDTIKCISSVALQWLFGLQIWSYQPLPGHHQVYLQHCNSVAVWTTSLVISTTAWTPSSASPALPFSGCLDYKSGHISHSLVTIKCISSTATQWLFTLQVWSYQPLPGHHQVNLQRFTSVAVWTTNLVISATAWTPSSVSPTLQFSGCLNYKSGHISHCLDTIKCISSTATPWLFGLQVWSYQPLPGHHKAYLQRCTSVAVPTTSLIISFTAWTPSNESPALHFCRCLDYKSGHISHCGDTIKCISSIALQWLFGLHVCYLTFTKFT